MSYNILFYDRSCDLSIKRYTLFICKTLQSRYTVSDFLVSYLSFLTTSIISINNFQLSRKKKKKNFLSQHTHRKNKKIYS